MFNKSKFAFEFPFYKLGILAIDRRTFDSCRVRTKIPYSLAYPGIWDTWSKTKIG
jgi:hypothetical protein